MPQSSVAVHVRVIVPVSPHAAKKLSEEVIVTPPHVSEPVAVPVAPGSVLIPHSTVTSAGQVTDGGIVSTTVII